MFTFQSINKFFGIIFNISGSFTAKGKFANSKISGIGRVVT